MSTMNNNKIIYGIGLIALSLAVFFLGIKAKDRLHFGDTHWGPPNQRATDSLSIDSVKQLVANGACDIEFIISDQERVVFYYNKEEIENLSSVQDSTLNIEFKNDAAHFFRKKSNRVMVKIYTRSINNIHQNGVGSITSEGLLEQEQITLKNDGVGTMEFEVKAKSMIISNGGVGSMNVSGEAETAEISNEGTGRIDAQALKLKNAVVRNEGIGSIDVFASETFDLSNEGIGSIEYYGSGKVINSHSEGIGSINKN